VGDPRQQAPAGWAGQVRLPAGHWFGERATTDILALVGKGKGIPVSGQGYRSARRQPVPDGGGMEKLGTTYDAFRFFDHRWTLEIFSSL
jgi:hypothetical protein